MQNFYNKQHFFQAYKKQPNSRKVAQSGNLSFKEFQRLKIAETRMNVLLLSFYLVLNTAMKSKRT